MVKKVINKIKSNKKFHLLYIGLFVLLGSMTLGYSALSTTLFLRGEATINKPEYLVAISSIKQGTATGGAYAVTKPSLENTEGSLNTKLPSNEAGLQYTLEIKNYGKTSTVLDYVFFSQSNPNVKFKLGGISIGDIITSGETRNVTITIEYWDDVTAPTEDTIATLFNLEFIKYESGYSNACTLNWDGTSTSEPKTRSVYDTTYYEINNANELAWFRNSVNNGNNKINAILTNDICLNSKTFEQIGTNPNFFGIFDGQNRTIKNYSFSQDEDVTNNYTYYAGLFRNNSGEIRNTSLSVNISDTTGYKPPFLGGNHTVTGNIGGLVTNNAGKIQNVLVSGSINVNNTIEANCSISRPNGYHYIGAITGQNSGVVTGSISKTSISINSTLNSRSCNYSKYEHLYEGGLIGQNSGYLSDSYNKEAVTSVVSFNHKNTEYYGHIGGLVGESTGGAIINGYSIGTITHTANIGDSDSDTILNTISGCAVGKNAGAINNIYFSDTCTYVGNGVAASHSDFVDPNLDVGFYLGNYYRIDRNNINNGYPILKWQ